jgi:hypothetical protein
MSKNLHEEDVLLCSQRAGIMRGFQKGGFHRVIEVSFSKTGRIMASANIFVVSRECEGRIFTVHDV